jgi:bacteriorhodopsin
MYSRIDFIILKLLLIIWNTYEPLVWDLNPEGIGVQPMIAVVDITFKF